MCLSADPVGVWGLEFDSVRFEKRSEAKQKRSEAKRKRKRGETRSVAQRSE